MHTHIFMCAKIIIKEKEAINLRGGAWERLEGEDLGGGK